MNAVLYARICCNNKMQNTTLLSRSSSLFLHWVIVNYYHSPISLPVTSFKLEYTGMIPWITLLVFLTRENNDKNVLCLTSFSTRFQLYRRGQFYGGGNRSILRKTLTCHKLVKLYHIMLHRVHLAWCNTQKLPINFS